MPHLETIVSVSSKEGIDVFNLQNGTHLRSIQVPVLGTAGGPVMLDEEHIVLPQSDRAALVVINTVTGQVKLRCPIAEHVRALAVSHAGDYLAAGAPSGKVYLWHVPSGELVRVWDAHYKGVSALAFSEDDSFLFSGGDDGILNVWLFAVVVCADTEDATARPPIHAEFAHHSLPVTSIVCGAGVSSGGKLFTTSLDRSVKAYSLVSRSITHSWSFPASVTALALDPTERFFCAAASDGAVYKYLLLAPTQSDEGSAGAAAGAWDAVNAATTAAASSSASAAGAAAAAQAASLAGVVAAANAVSAGASGLAFRGHSAPVTGASLSINGAILVTSSADGTVRLWDTPTRQCLRTLSARRAGVACVSLLSDPLSALNLRAVRTTRRAWAPFTKHLLPSLPLRAMDASGSLRPGHSRGTVAVVTLARPYVGACGDDPAAAGPGSWGGSSEPPCGPYALTVTPALAPGGSGAGVGLGEATAAAMEMVAAADAAVAAANIATAAAVAAASATGGAGSEKEAKNGRGKRAAASAEDEEQEGKDDETSSSAREAELEAEVQKWKKTAADLYKKLQKAKKG